MEDNLFDLKRTKIYKSVPKELGVSRLSFCRLTAEPHAYTYTQESLPEFGSNS